MVVADPAGYLFALWTSNDPSLASGAKGEDYDLVMALAGHPCGNGTLDSGETCDDGDRGSLDCCGRACTFDPAGTVCAADADLCTLERCDGDGTCAHPSAPFGTPCTRDADICTFDRCDGNFACEHILEPHTGCRVPITPRSSTVKIASDSAKRKLEWKWRNGPATALSELSLYVWGADYALCAYDGAGLVARADIPGHKTCSDGKQCWKPTKHGWTYADHDATPSGVKKATFRAGGEDGKTSFKVVAQGPNLGAPALPISSLPLHVQLISDAQNICFDSTYSAAGVKTTSAVQFQARSD